MSKLLVYVLVGKLIVFISQKFPFQKVPLIGRLFEEGKFLEELLSCDLCVGVWVYTFLAFFFSVNLFEEWFYVIGLTEFLVGAVTSFIVHLISMGWKAQYSVFVVE
jgi:hypothetical protein